MKYVILLLAVFVAGCNNDHVWDEIELCESRYKEKCTIVVIPVSNFDDVVAAVNEH